MGRRQQFGSATAAWEGKHNMRRKQEGDDIMGGRSESWRETNSWGKKINSCRRKAAA